MRRAWSAALLLALLAPAAQAAPFSYDPVSFAGFANASFKRDGKRLFVKNLGTCLREGKDKTGYRCLSGDLLEDQPAKQGRNFCKIDAVWYVPFSKTVQLRPGPCQFRSDKQRLMNEGQQLLRQGLEQLENFKR